MKITHEDDGKRGRFLIPGDDGGVLGEMVYVWAGNDKLIIEHTEISDTLRGKGAGLALLQSLVAMAREKHIKVIPLCPFANATFKRHPELADVLT